MSLVNSFRSRTFVRHGLLCLLLAPAVGAVIPATALAIKANCRDLEFNGAAGDASHDNVTFQVKDSLNTLLDESCVIQVQPSESAISFASRIPGAWGTSQGTVCPAALPTDNKTCGTVGTGYSCKHTWVFKAGKLPADPPRKKFLRICCFESPNCKGPALGKPTKKLCTQGIVGPCTQNSECDSPPGMGNGRCSRRPITIQTKVESLAYTPADNEIPFAGGITGVAVDPIGMTQRPFKSLQSCRHVLGVGLTQLAHVTLGELVGCHLQVMKGDPNLTGADCNGVSALSDPSGAIDAAKAKLSALANAVCAPSGSPLSLGYKSCPSPCAGDIINTCTAGFLIGYPCSSHAQCDYIIPGSGHCGGPGDWSAAADCMSCLEEAAVTAAVTDKYGPTGPGVVGQDISAEAGKCQDTIGDTLRSLIHAHLSTTVSCQLKVDTGSTALPEKGICVAGNVVPCSTDPDCDTTVGMGDGKCGVDGLCVAGQVTQCATDPDCDVGTCGPFELCTAGNVGLPCGTNRDCVVGTCGISGLCTAGNVGLPCATYRDCEPERGSCNAGFCKNVDYKGKRTAAESSTMTHINGGCDDLTVAELQGCGTDEASVMDCVIENGRKVGGALSDALFPEGIGH